MDSCHTRRCHNIDDEKAQEIEEGSSITNIRRKDLLPMASKILQEERQWLKRDCGDRVGVRKVLNHIYIYIV